NVTYMVNSSQSSVAAYKYDPFGNLISSSGTLAGANVYRFSSKEQHVNSGMYYYGFRFYDPNLQRWISRDPMDEQGGLNLYAFVFNDPEGSIDPLGETAVGKGVAKACRLGAKSLRKAFKPALSRQEAIDAVKRGEDVIANSRNAAKHIAQGAGDGKQPIHEIDKKTGSPHYHPHGR